ncbi:MAG: flagellar biosynthetic protein FliO [Legionella sp.]
MKKYICLISLVLLLPGAVCAASSAEAINVLSRAELLRIIGGLLFVLLIILALSWLVKRLNVVQLASAKGFHSIATMTLGPKERVTLLKVGERHLLLGLAAGSVSLLYDFGTELPQGFDKQEKAGFAQLLKSAMRQSS